MDTRAEEPGPLRAERRGFAPTLVGGTAILLLLVLASQLYVWINLWPISITWGEALLLAVPHLVVWAALIPLMVVAARRLPIGGTRPLLRVAGHVALGVAFSALALALLDVSDRILGWTTVLGAPGKLVTDIRLTVVHLHLGMSIYWVVVAVTHAFRYYDVSREREVRASRLEAELARAELQALRMQLDPHFLFNTLNSIGVLVREDPEGAERMIHRLSDLLHGTLRHSGSDRVRLREEIRCLESYLRIEETRFGDRLTVTCDVPEELLDVRVPFLVLQPLVENAIRHGLAPEPRAGTLRVAAAREGDDLVLEVEDDGRGLPPGFGPSAHGVGLTNTELRVERLYGEAGSVCVESRAGRGTRVVVRIPLEPAPGAAAVAEAPP